MLHLGKDLKLIGNLYDTIIEATNENYILVVLIYHKIANRFEPP